MKNKIYTAFIILAVIILSSCSAPTSTGHGSYTDASRDYVKSPNGNIVNVRGLPANTRVKDPITGEVFHTPHDANSLRVQELAQKQKERSSLDDVMKGLVVVGGSAVLAHGGVDPSQISEYAAGVINDNPHQALSAASNANTQPSALNREAQRQQRETRERLAGTRPYSGASGSPASSNQTTHSAIQEPSSGISPSNKQNGKMTKRQMAFVTTQTKLNSGVMSDVDFYYDFKSQAEVRRAAKLKFQGKHITQSFGSPYSLSETGGCFTVVQGSYKDSQGSVVNRYSIGYGSDFNQSRADATRRIKALWGSVKNISNVKTGTF